MGKARLGLGSSQSEVVVSGQSGWRYLGLEGSQVFILYFFFTSTYFVAIKTMQEYCSLNSIANSHELLPVLKEMVLCTVRANYSGTIYFQARPFFAEIEVELIVTHDTVSNPVRLFHLLRQRRSLALMCLRLLDVRVLDGQTPDVDVVANCCDHVELSSVS